MTIADFSGITNNSMAFGTVFDSYQVKTVVVVDTESIVREYFADIPIMIEIARCESTFRHTLEDGSVLTGFVDDRDTGVMQINTGYHAATAEDLGFDLKNIFDNMTYARTLYERQGTQPWNASKPCWGRMVASI